MSSATRHHTSLHALSSLPQLAQLAQERLDQQMGNKDVIVGASRVHRLHWTCGNPSTVPHWPCIKPLALHTQDAALGQSLAPGSGLRFSCDQLSSCCPCKTTFIKTKQSEPMRVCLILATCFMHSLPCTTSLLALNTYSTSQGHLPGLTWQDSGSWSCMDLSGTGRLQRHSIGKECLQFPGMIPLPLPYCLARAISNSGGAMHSGACHASPT